MSSRPLRFVQAGDFLLHQPMRGLMDVPDHLAERLIKAPYQAAERVFDVALAEDVDFILLTGNLCDPQRSGPRGLVFLAGQFARLAERGISVYWAAGAEDCRRDWPTLVKWPTGVHVFAANRVEHVIHHRDGTPICQIAGRSVDGPTSAAPIPAAVLAPNPDGLFAIAIIPGALPCSPGELPAIGNHYWACGGASQAATALCELDPPCVVHFAGSPQGRSPHDLDPGGCAVVHVDNGDHLEPRERIRLLPVATDVVRWHEERMLLPSSLEQVEYERLLHDRMGSLIAAAPDRMHLIRWCIEGSPMVADRLNPAGLAAELLAMLRSEYGFRETPAWSVSLSFVPPELPASWSEQQTLLGEFLRRARDLKPVDIDGSETERNADSAVDCYLDCFLSEQQRVRGLSDLVGLADPASSTKVLRQAAALGAELLAPSTALHGDSSRSRGAASR